jgi:hypothetical protein
MLLGLVISTAGLANSSAIINASSAAPQPQESEGSITAQESAANGPHFVHVTMSSEPPASSREQRALVERQESLRPLPQASPLPAGETAVRRPDSAVNPSTQTTENNAADNQGANAPNAPGTFTLFRNSDLGATIKANTSGLTGEPAAANSGSVVFATGNWWAAISADGGQTFNYIDVFSMFPASFGGFCCDQVTVYDPARDLFLWSLQYLASGPAGAGQNLFRIAAAHPSDALQGNWWYYDFTSDTNTEYDFPDLCLTNDFAYYFTNRGTYGAGTVNTSFAFKLPLDPISTGVGFGFSWINFGSSGFTNLSWHCARGGRETAYFASHNTTSQVRIFRWAENTGTLFWDDVNLSAAWPNAVHVCPTPDGRDWCGFDDGRIKAGWVSRGMIGFMWNASAGGGFAVPYVEAARFRESDRVYIDRPYIWNSTLAFQYPDAAPNVRGDVGIVVHFSSTTENPSFYVGIDDDFSRDSGYGPPAWEVYFVRGGTQGPNANRWGDYFSVQPFAPNGLGWIATGTTMQGCGVAGCKETRYEIFGRERDLRGIQKYYDPFFGLFVPLVRRP